MAARRTRSGASRGSKSRPSHLRIERPSRQALYDVTVTRNAYGAITSTQDGDGVGLDHTATFAYDGAGRLTQAIVGNANDQYRFGYAYDGLQNMVSRSAVG